MGVVCFLYEYGPGLTASRVGACTGQPRSHLWKGMECLTRGPGY